MKLSSLFIQGNQSHIEGSGKENSSALEQSLKNGMEKISSKTPGQSIAGEVVDKNGNDLLIAIGKNQLVRARLDGNMSVDLGQLMTFTIKNAGASKVVLSPLYANTGNDPNISRALQMAGILENAESIKMVQTMMKEGMSIDRDSLAQMMRAVNLNPGANIETLVQLARLGIPVTEDNLFQMEAYKNYEHQMTEGLLEIADALADTFSELTAADDVQGGVNLYKEIISMLTGQGGKSPDGEVIRKGNMGEAPLRDEMSVLKEENQAKVQEEALKDRGGLNEKELGALSRELSQAGMPDNLVKSFVSGELSSSELLDRINEMLLKENLLPEQRDSITELLSGKALNALLKNEISKKWMLSPEDVAKDKEVSKLYERLNNQLNRLNQVLEQTAKADTPLGKAASNLSGNIDFMNQMNQMFTYVQLPLKLHGQEANGDLYVYTNKKNLAKKDGEVSALLHLDMDHLGSVDVHVTMKDNNVSTKFYLKNDSALDLIANNIDMLNERLNKKGYSMSASFVKKGEEEPDNVMEEILKQDKNISILSGYSFDARA